MVEYGVEGVGKAEDGGGDGVGYWGGFLRPTLERIALGKINIRSGRIKLVVTVADEGIGIGSESSVAALNTTV